jgi:TRAP-type C4-dicarboxylate transport system permease small subunit
MQRALAIVNTWCAWAAGLILLMSLAAVLYAITVRYLFSVGATWAFDFTSYGLLFVVFLAAPRTLQVDGHVRIDFLLARLKEKAKRLTEVVAWILSIAFLLMLLWAVSRKTAQSIEGDWVSPSMHEIPLRYVYWVMPAGTALMLLVGAFKLRGAIARWRQFDAASDR